MVNLLDAFSSRDATPTVPQAGTTGTESSFSQKLQQVFNPPVRTFENSAGSIIGNFLHSTGTNTPQRTIQLQFNPSFASATLQQVRLKINEDEFRVIELNQQIQPIPAKQGTTRRIQVGSRRTTIGISRRRVRFIPIFENRFFESAQSAANRITVQRQNNKIKSQISKINSELNQLRNQEKEMIRLQAQITNNQNEAIRLQKEATDREKSFFDQLGAAIAGAIPQQQSSQTIIIINPVTGEEEIQEPKKQSNTPLLIAAAVLGVVFLG